MPGSPTTQTGIVNTVTLLNNVCFPLTTNRYHTMTIPRPLVLVILDGWGHREETEANAIAAAHKPNFDRRYTTYPHTLISGSGQCVGLPQGQMGNSEVGHLNIGSGRIVLQDLTRIDDAIEKGDFFD